MDWTIFWSCGAALWILEMIKLTGVIIANWDTLKTQQTDGISLPFVIIIAIIFTPFFIGIITGEISEHVAELKKKFDSVAN